LDRWSLVDATVVFPLGATVVSVDSTDSSDVMSIAGGVVIAEVSATLVVVWVVVGAAGSSETIADALGREANTVKTLNPVVVHEIVLLAVSVMHAGSDFHVPDALTALTRKSYGVPLASPVTLAAVTVDVPSVNVFHTPDADVLYSTT
jgi:hypothetical protein